MSFHEDSVHEPDQPQKPRIQRRHGACEPCRFSKTKCDGREPCGACRSERRRQSPCVYSEKARKLQIVTAEIRRRAESERKHGDEGAGSSLEDDSSQSIFDGSQESARHSVAIEDTDHLNVDHQGRGFRLSEADMNNAKMPYRLSVCAIVEEFKRLKPARGHSAQVVSRCSGFEVSQKSMAENHTNKPVQVPMSSPEVCSRSCNLLQEPVEVQVLGTRLEAVDGLVQMGQLKQAWVGLAGVVREAQLYQDTMSHDGPTASPSWRRTWDSILDLEAQLGLTTGFPICLIPNIRSRPSVKQDTVLLEDSLEEIRADLYQHTQGILGLDLNNPTAIRDFLERAQKIIDHEPFNQIGLCTTEGHSAAVHDLHLDTHVLFMVVFCRMASLCDLLAHDLTNGTWSDSPAAEIIKRLSLHQTRQKSSYCRRMFRSANFILDSFVQLHQTNVNLTGKDWIRCHSAYVAAMVLGIAKVRHEVDWQATTDTLKVVEEIFLTQSFRHPRCVLFRCAVNRLKDLASVKAPASETVRNRHTGVKNRKQQTTVDRPTSPLNIECRTRSDMSGSASTSPTTMAKRSIDMVDGPTDYCRLPRERSFQGRSQSDEVYEQQPKLDTSYDEEHLGPLVFFDQDNSATYSTPSTSFTTIDSATSSATSVSDTDLALHGVNGISLHHPGPPFAYPFPYQNFHPPMTWNNNIYTIDGANPTPLSLQIEIPTVSHFTHDASPTVHGTATSFSFSESATTKSSINSSHLSSPLHVPMEGTMAGTSIPPALQADQGLQCPGGTVSMTANENGVEQMFVQHTDGSLMNDELTERLLKTSPERRHTVNAVAESAPHPRETQALTSIRWQRTPVLTMSRDIQSSISGQSPSVSASGRGLSTNNAQQMNMAVQRQEQGSYYPRAVEQSAPGLLDHQMFHGERENCVTSGPGVYGQTQLHNHYPQGSMQYPEYYISGSGQMSEQWRPTIDTGGPMRRPFHR